MPKPCPTCGGSGFVPETVRGAFVVEDDRDEDNAPTLRIPPVRDSIGARRRPPAPVVAELLEHAELTRALLEELSRYDEDDAR